MLDALPGCSALESDVRSRAHETDVKDAVMSARLSPIFPPSHLAHLSADIDRYLSTSLDPVNLQLALFPTLSPSLTTSPPAQARGTIKR
jgi:hypothetical protein